MSDCGIVKDSGIVSESRTYLDYNASAPLRPCARGAMLAALDEPGNPSSVHAEGRRARAVVERAREAVAALVAADPGEVVFTSGATEANATVIAAGWDTVIATGLEHDSVLGPAKASGAWVVLVPAAQSGIIAADDLAQSLTQARGRTLVCVQRANNETGVIQPVAELAAIARGFGACVHTDAVQAAGRIAAGLAATGADYLSLSSHKIGGPKGIGALIIRGDRSLSPLIPGGGQERGRRAGTENVAAIAGFGAAAEAAVGDLAGMPRIKAMRDRLEAAIVSITPSAVVIGADAPRLPNTSSIAVPGVLAETLVIRLDLAGFAVSAGAACSSGKVGPSRVLAAMGLPPEFARGAIRISLGHDTTSADIAQFCAAWENLFANSDAVRNAFAQGSAFTLERVA